MPWNNIISDFFLTNIMNFASVFFYFHWRSSSRDQEWSNWFCESHSFSGSSIPVRSLLWVQQFPSCTQSMERVQQHESCLFSGGEDFLSEIIHNKSNLWSGFVLFLEDFIEEELEKGSSQSLCVAPMGVFGGTNWCCGVPRLVGWVDGIWQVW